MISVRNPLFKLGAVVATPGAIEKLERAGVSVWSLVSRHCSGDFGDVDAEDRKANLQAIQDGDRILSAYTLRTVEKIWVITEADRSSSCCLLPSEY